LVLRLDSGKLTGEVRFEPAAPVGQKEPAAFGTRDEQPLFPHLYGTIDVDAVVAELNVVRDGSGTFTAIDGL
jgi:uncharacterized protein (DUF952 family)